jgi:hypothetical protein
MKRPSRLGALRSLLLSGVLLACGGPPEPAAGTSTSTTRASASAPSAVPANPNRPVGKLEDFLPGDGFGSPCFTHAGSLYRYATTGDRKAPWKIVRIELQSRKQAELWRGDSMGPITFNAGAAFKVTHWGVLRIPLNAGSTRLFEIEGVEDAVPENGQVWIRRIREIGDRGPVTEVLTLAFDTGAVTQVATVGQGLLRSTNSLFLSPTKMAVLAAPRRGLNLYDRKKSKFEQEFVLGPYLNEVMANDVENGELSVQAGVSAVFDGPLMYFLYNRQGGHAVVAANPAEFFPDSLHADAREWQALASLQMDDAYLYYPVLLPEDGESRLSLLRLYKGGGEPQEIAKLSEGFSTAMDGDFIYLCGVASGKIQRLRVR